VLPAGGIDTVEGRPAIMTTGLLEEKTLSLDETLARIAARKAALAKHLLILGHHYQVEEVVRFADYTGDSFKLARIGAEHPEADFIVFLGVHFMAESTDILAAPHQQVILPDLAAGCSMADMANVDQVESAYAELTAGGRDDLMPITYMNSSAAIKAFCGRMGGAVCTSSNAQKLITWALAERRRLVFMPDQHLGRNVSYHLGIPLSDMAVWDPHALPEENFARGCDRARVILWKGHCSVHAKFLPEHVDHVRKTMPGVRVLVHPECSWEVVQKADEWGSTEKIIKVVEASPPGSKWAIGTEINLVSRIAHRFPDKTIVSLSGINCLCATMYRIDPPHLLAALDAIAEGRPVNRILVDPETKRDAKLALDRMLLHGA
jgi:quinolinate synthase